VPVPVLIDMPHCGDIYPPDFQYDIDSTDLVGTDHRYAHIFSTSAPSLGAHLLKATVARNYLDCNEDAFLIDPRMFNIPKHFAGLIEPTDYVSGAFPRVLSAGQFIDCQKLGVSEGRARLKRFYFPYRQELRRLASQLSQRFPVAVHLNCSMPDHNQQADVCLSNDMGNSADQALVTALEMVVRKFGLTLATTGKQAMGSIVREIGDPLFGIHSVAIQLSHDIFADDSINYEQFAEAMIGAAAEFAGACHRGERAY
jgi:N-formylglutamate amidohydrolase